MDRKVINIFKSFIEKVFVPQLNKMDFTCQQEWNKFSNMISLQPINLAQLQIYVDSINLARFGGMSNFNSINNSNGLANINSLNFNKQNDRNQNKSPLFSKIRKQSTNQGTNNSGGFNPSRTFGGERARMMFPLKDFDQPSTQAQQVQADRQNYNFSKDFSKNKQDAQPGFSTQAFLPTIEKLFKVFSENQVKLEKVGASNLPPSYQHKNYYN